RWRVRRRWSYAVQRSGAAASHAGDAARPRFLLADGKEQAADRPDLCIWIGNVAIPEKFLCYGLAYMSDDVFHEILKKAARFGASKNCARFDEIVVRLITGCARARRPSTNPLTN